jgi:hypothetical protein
MKKDKRPIKPRALELKKERLVVLTEAQLENVVGGNKTTVPSQCVTLCF